MTIGYTPGRRHEVIHVEQPDGTVKGQTVTVGVGEHPDYLVPDGHVEVPGSAVFATRHVDPEAARDVGGRVLGGHERSS